MRMNVLRRVERLACWEPVRQTAALFYSDFGRPGIDPVMLVKVFLVNPGWTEGGRVNEKYGGFHDHPPERPRA